METLAALIARDGKLTPQEAAGWTLRLAQRVQEQHQQGLVHGNVSAYTLLVSGRSPLGKGLLIDSPRQAEATFYSPERASSGQLSQADDTWALAVLLFYGLTAQYPFQVNSAIDIARAVALGTPKLARYGVNDPILQSLFDRALARDPSKRLSTVAELVQSIQQWIKDPSIANIEPLEDDDEDAPTMMMQSVSIGSPQQKIQAPQAPLPTPRPAAGAPAVPVATPPPPVGLPPIPSPPPAPSGTAGVAAIDPRQAPTIMAVHSPEVAPPPSAFSKGTLTALWITWAVVTFGGAAVEYIVLSR
ncbi:MAG: hypothetical protein RMJ98_14240 [Myxococcales bacterium]|nr:hypothetical protein [Polyangiaceae bacterium]MDW8250452.1 hypothetical protein [Myxococcales bacterium]